MTIAPRPGWTPAGPVRHDSGSECDDSRLRPTCGSEKCVSVEIGRRGELERSRALVRERVVCGLVACLVDMGLPRAWWRMGPWRRGRLVSDGDVNLRFVRSAQRAPAMTARDVTNDEDHEPQPIPEL
jgi:hypothetical protein